MKKITLDLINSFDPCYDPADVGVSKEMKLTPKQFIKEFKNKVKDKEDIIWLLCRNEFISEKNLRLFAVWCAREALKLIENPDLKSINACDIAEKYANKQCSAKELAAARKAAWEAAGEAAGVAAWEAAGVAAWEAARVAAGAAAGAAAWKAARAAAGAAARKAAWEAAGEAARETQIEKLKEFLNK